MNSATWHDLVKRLIPGSTEEECDFFLWETTCYPFGSPLRVARQLKITGKAIASKQSVCFRCGDQYENGGKIDFGSNCEPCRGLSKLGG